MKIRMHGLGILLIVFCCIYGFSLNVEAATNPFSDWPWPKNNQTERSFLGDSRNYNEFYLYSKKEKITGFTATSSNTKVAKIAYRTDGHNAYLHIKGKNVGKTKIKVKVKVGNKLYTRTFYIQYYKYVSPFQSFKIGNKNYASKFSKLEKTWGDLSGYCESVAIIRSYSSNEKLFYQLKPWYEIEYITLQRSDGEAGQIEIKNNKKIPKGWEFDEICYRDVKKDIYGIIKVRKRNCWISCNPLC